MTDLFGSLLVDSLVPRWKHYALGTALFTWFVTAGLVLLAQPRIADVDSCDGWHMIVCWPLTHGTAGRWALAIGAGVVVVGTAALVNGLAPSLFATLAGANWPARAECWAAGRRRRHATRRAGLRTRFLDGKVYSKKTGSLRAQERWRHYPRVETEATRIGNTLAAAREHVLKAYGLNVAAVWGPLVTAMPDAARIRLAEHSNNVYLRTQQLLFALLTPLWLLIAVTAEWAWPSRLIVAGVLLLVSAVSIVFAWHRVCAMAEEYADHMEDLVMVYRRDLYAASGLGMPKTTAEERVIAEQLGRWLLNHRTTALPLTWSPPP
ncbi:hypothetical protein AB0A95_13365 [Micromonospora sp. NPDC049230]|uniref:hypothetical protein n=1 Tax=Micromonospora sp. NPDC049230 TaxID=3155502 RepID=UPI0033F09955